MIHLALGLEYNGRPFRGFQRQSGERTVQGELELALSQVADEPITIAAAGRTDTGVHAMGQVVGFSTNAQRPLHGWQRGANSLTDANISVRWVREVEAEFHPRYSAAARRYIYIWCEDEVPSPVLHGLVTPTKPLATEAMHEAGQHLLGEHDFTSFRGAGCQSRSRHRCVHNLQVRRFADLVVLDITANAFLLHMVRNIAGALLQVGRQEQPVAWVPGLLRARDRRLLGPTAPPAGLYLASVYYPQQSFPPAPMPGPLRGLQPTAL